MPTVVASQVLRKVVPLDGPEERRRPRARRLRARTETAPGVGKKSMHLIIGQLLDQVDKLLARFSHDDSLGATTPPCRLPIHTEDHWARVTIR